MSLIKEYGGYSYKIHKNDLIHIRINIEKLASIRRQKQKLYINDGKYFPATHDKKLVKGYCIKGDYYDKNGNENKAIKL